VLRGTKEKLKAQKRHLQNAIKEKDRVLKELDNIQIRQEQGENLYDQEKEVLEKLNRIIQAEEKYWMQRSKIT